METIDRLVFYQVEYEDATTYKGTVGIVTTRYQSYSTAGTITVKKGDYFFSGVRVDIKNLVITLKKPFIWEGKETQILTWSDVKEAMRDHARTVFNCGIVFTVGKWSNLMPTQVPGYMKAFLHVEPWETIEEELTVATMNARALGDGKLTTIIKYETAVVRYWGPQRDPGPLPWVKYRQTYRSQPCDPLGEFPQI